MYAQAKRFRAGCAAIPEAPLLSISALLPALPGFPSPQSCAPWPVGRGSVAGPVRFAVLSRKEAAKLWQDAPVGSRHASARSTWRYHRAHRPGRALRPALRLPEPSDGPARPVSRRDRREGRLLLARRGQRACPAARPRPPGMATALRGDARCRGPVPIAATDQCLCRAAAVIATTPGTSPRSVAALSTSSTGAVDRITCSSPTRSRPARPDVIKR